MKAPIAHFLIVMLAFATAAAQQIESEIKEEPTAEETAAAEEPSAEEPADEKNEEAEAAENPEQEPAKADEPQPAEEAAAADEPPAEAPPAPAAEEVLEQSPAAPAPGLAVRVERVQAGAGNLDPSQVKLLAPFPAKLLAQVPNGWRIEKAGNAPPFTREVELSPGSTITLSVQPHILVPEADGESVFAVSEPGYNAPLGYRQDATVGAILATSIRQLDEDARQLGGAIDQLQQLLVSLPQPEPTPQENPAPARKQ
jgi:chemotaxis protein histidine kinase CheA